MPRHDVRQAVAGLVTTFGGGYFSGLCDLFQERSVGHDGRPRRSIDRLWRRRMNIYSDQCPSSLRRRDGEMERDVSRHRRVHSAARGGDLGDALGKDTRTLAIKRFHSFESIRG